MRRVAVVLVLVAAVWPGAGLGDGAQAAPAMTAARVQADFNNDGADDLAVGVPGPDSHRLAAVSLSLGYAINLLSCSGSLAPELLDAHLPLKKGP